MRARILITLCVALATMDRTGGESAVRPRSSTFALTHVRVVDGSGRPGRDDQTIVVESGRITSVAPSATAHVPAAIETLDYRGKSVIPGLVGMHDHLFYAVGTSATKSVSAHSAFAKLYLASGVTTIRTAGTIDFEGDRRLKQRIDAGNEPGPTIHLTAPYLDGTGAQPDPEGIARVVTKFADAGATSFKAYTSLRGSELKAAIEAAHARGLQVTGHLCAVGFGEAATLGIDNVEHGVLFDTGLYSGKQPDVCPDQNAVFAQVGRMDVTDVRIQQTIAHLIRHGVAVTSTLAVLESFTGSDEASDAQVKLLLSPRLRDDYQKAADAMRANGRFFGNAFRTEMAFERAFFAAGGRLLAGADPTGWGGVVAGLGDQRGVELLVRAGLSPENAIRVATRNGADFMRQPDIGSIEPGYQADLVVLQDDPTKNIANIRKVETVFKGGVAYDPAPLIAAAQGGVGAFETSQFLAWPALTCMSLVAVMIVRRSMRGSSTS
jgi:imidazolonepropionase-like amidohydrolase